MAKLSGTWNLRAVTRNAGWQQRVVITGSANRDGAYPMVVGSVVSGVQGDRFEVTTQALNPVSGAWVNSFQRDVMSWNDVDGIVITIFADDATSQPDGDFDDLVVLCTPQDEELRAPEFRQPRLDLTIPEKYVRRRRPPRRRPER